MFIFPFSIAQAVEGSSGNNQVTFGTRQIFDKIAGEISQSQLETLSNKYISLKSQYGKRLVYGIGHCFYSRGFKDFQMRNTASDLALDAFEKVIKKRNEAGEYDYTMMFDTVFVPDIHGGWFAVVYGHMD